MVLFHAVSRGAAYTEKRIGMSELSPDAGGFMWPVRVYYEDTDSAGVVYYANYLRYFERARTEWLRALGFEQPELAARHQIVFVVRSINVEYLQPARFNDELQISVELDAPGASQIVFVQRVLRGVDVLSEAQVRVACVSLLTHKPVRMPKTISAALSADLSADLSEKITRTT
jgi:acyl-CoA thioester hydrolase